LEGLRPELSVLLLRRLVLLVLLLLLLGWSLVVMEWMSWLTVWGQ
jgi:hypothetical protein